MNLLPVPLLEVIWQQIEHLFYWHYSIMFLNWLFYLLQSEVTHSIMFLNWLFYLLQSEVTLQHQFSPKKLDGFVFEGYFVHFMFTYFGPYS